MVIYNHVFGNGILNYSMAVCHIYLSDNLYNKQYIQF